MIERILIFFGRHFKVVDGKVYHKLEEKLYNVNKLKESIYEVFGGVSYLIEYVIERFYEANNLDTYRLFYKYPEFLLPISIRVSAQTIGHDLVAVKPMAAPLGLINFVDFVDPLPTKQEEVQYPDIQIQIKERQDNLSHNTLNKWKSIIDSQRKRDW